MIKENVSNSKGQGILNIANALTLSRILWAAVLIYLLEQHSLMGNILSVIVFIIASLTDYYDGYFAKTRGLSSDFGKIMDPVADKILLLSVFGVLAQIGMIAWWMFIIIALREIVVTISRLGAMRQGQVLAAERMGKIKTVVQIIAVLVILLYLVARESGSWFYSVQGIWLCFNYCLMIAAVVLTVYSGVDYFRNKKLGS